MKSIWMTSVLAVALCACANSAFAAVSAEEAAKLKSTLTPNGAEKAGNADGSIPAWTGGMTGSASQYYVNGRRPDPFAGEKPLYSVTSSNMAQYKDLLSEGLKGMIAKYPDSFRLDVYPTHRSAAFPQWYYDKTLKNATSVTIANKGDQPLPENYTGATPYPIPTQGIEAIWNHLLRWQGTRSKELIDGVLVTADGRRVVTQNGSLEFWYPQNDPDAKFDGRYLMFKNINTGPPIRAGEALVVQDYIDHSEDRAWVYLTGQRRVRMLPNACCDTPSPGAAGVVSFDEYYVFANTPSRFDWSLVGKKELLIPYNSNMTLVPTSRDTVLSAHHMNPDYVRWEKHRVWVVEAKLKSGQRHVYPHSVYYLDEDSWSALLAERYDSGGNLARVIWTLPAVAPDLPGLVGTINGFYDLMSGAWYVANMPNNYNQQWDFNAQSTEADFTGDALAAGGIR